MQITQLHLGLSNRRFHCVTLVLRSISSIWVFTSPASSSVGPPGSARTVCQGFALAPPSVGSAVFFHRRLPWGPVLHQLDSIHHQDSHPLLLVPVSQLCLVLVSDYVIVCYHVYLLSDSLNVLCLFPACIALSLHRWLVIV